MKGSETERTRAFASRINGILNGSKQAKSIRVQRNRMQREQHSEAIALVGLESKESVSSMSPAFKQAREPCSGQSLKAAGDLTRNIIIGGTADGVSVVLYDISTTSGNLLAIIIQ